MDIWVLVNVYKSSKSQKGEECFVKAEVDAARTFAKLTKW